MSYCIIWTKGKEKRIDENIFETKTEAITYANIESTQIECEGWKFRIIEI